jgi:hypothetical protein
MSALEYISLSLSKSLLPLPLSFLTAFPSSLRKWTLPPAIADQDNDRRSLSDSISLYFPFLHVSQRICTFFRLHPHPISGARQDLPILQTGRMPVEIRTCQISHPVIRRTRYGCTRSISHDRLFAWPLGLSLDGYWRVGARM